MPFIVGVGRSGTTLLRLMLDAHPDLCIPPETGFIPAAAGGSRDQFFKIISQFETWKDFDLAEDEFLAALRCIEPFVLADGVRAFYRLYALRLGKSR